MEYTLKQDDNLLTDPVHDDITEDDEDLVRAAQKSHSAFAPLYRRYASRVYRYIYSRVGDVHETEDLTAQVFTDVISALPKYHSQGNFAGWLFTFAYRRCADYHRKPTTVPLLEQFIAGAIQDPVGQTEQQEVFDHLYQILIKLDYEELELLRLRYAAKLPYRDIANILGRSEGAIKMGMSRLIQKMKAQWEVENE